MEDTKTTAKMANLSEPIAGFIFTTIFLILVNSFYKDVQFLTQDFELVLPLYNLSLVVSIVLHLTKIFVRSKVYKVFTDVIANVFFVLIAFQFWVIFPFDTSVIGDKALWDSIFKALIVFPPIAYTIATFVSLISLATKKK